MSESKLHFKAEVLHASKETSDKFYMIGAADDKFDYKNYFIAQKSYKGVSNSEELEELYVEYSIDNGKHYNAQYNSCKKVTLSEKQMVLDLDDVTIEVDVANTAISEKFAKYAKNIFGNMLESSL